MDLLPVGNTAVGTSVPKLFPLNNDTVVDRVPHQRRWQIHRNEQHEKAQHQCFMILVDSTNGPGWICIIRLTQRNVAASARTIKTNAKTETKTETKWEREMRIIYARNGPLSRPPSLLSKGFANVIMYYTMCERIYSTYVEIANARNFIWAKRHDCRFVVVFCVCVCLIRNKMHAAWGIYFLLFRRRVDFCSFAHVLRRKGPRGTWHANAGL